MFVASPVMDHNLISEYFEFCVSVFMCLITWFDVFFVCVSKRAQVYI